MGKEPFWDSSRGRFPPGNSCCFAYFTTDFLTLPKISTMRIWLWLGITSGRAMRHRDGVGTVGALERRLFPEEQQLLPIWSHLTQGTRNLATQHFHTGTVCVVYVCEDTLVFTLETVPLSEWENLILWAEISWSFRLTNLSYTRPVHLHTTLFSHLWKRDQSCRPYPLPPHI